MDTQDVRDRTRRSGGAQVANAFDELLEWIVRKLVIPDAQKDVDLNASAEESAEAIASEKEKIAEGAVDRARSLASAFGAGLLLAFEAQAIGKSEIRLDDRDPQQNVIADALITYLVGFDLAESRSEETEPGHYDYYIEVKWDALYRTADGARIDLPAALARQARIPGG
jgi:hypothetical protein